MKLRMALAVALSATCVTVLLASAANALNANFYDSRKYSNGGDVADNSSNANIYGAVGSNSYVRKAKVHFSAYFSGKTGKIVFRNFNFCPGVGGDNGTASGFGNGAAVTKFTVRYRKNNTKTIKEDFTGKKNQNCNASHTIDVNFGNTALPDEATGRHEVVVKVEQLNVRGNVVDEAPSLNVQNLFNASASSTSGSARIAHKGGGSSGAEVTVDQLNSSPANTNYRIRFGADCSVKNTNPRKISMYDVDNNGGGGAQLNGKVTLRLEAFAPGSNSGSFINLATNRNMSGGAKTVTPASIDNRTQSFWFKPAPGYRYVLYVNNVYHNNTLQYSTPFDGIYWETGCNKWKATGQSYIQKREKKANGDWKDWSGWGVAGRTVSIKQGERVRWRHSVAANASQGPATFNARAQRQGFGASSFSNTRPITRVQALVGSLYINTNANGRTDNDTRVTVSASAANGQKICERVRLNPGSGLAGAGAVYSAPACAIVGNSVPPAGYSITPTLSTIPSVSEPGASIDAKGTLTRSGTVTRNTAWGVAQYKVGAVGDAFPAGQHGSDATMTTACSIPRAGVSDCTSVPGYHASSDAMVQWTSSSAVSRTSTSMASIPSSAVAGDIYCYNTYVHYFTNTSALGRVLFSAPQCTTIGKRPKVHFMGGDLRVSGAISTAQSVSSGRLFGSWVEYGLFAAEGYEEFNYPASGYGFGSEGVSASTGWGGSSGYNALTFVNAESPMVPITNPAIDYPGYRSSLVGESTAEAFKAMTASSGATFNANLRNTASGVYDVGDVTISGTNIPNGRSIIIRSSGTVTIGDDITLRGDSMQSMADISQVVIVANAIKINSGVKRVDAWLLTTSSSSDDDDHYIDTCANVDVDNLTADTCNSPLRINGAVYTSSLRLKRTYGAEGSDSKAKAEAAEVIDLRADAHLWAHYYGIGSERAQTAYTRELPPRY